MPPYRRERTKLLVIAFFFKAGVAPACQNGLLRFIGDPWDRNGYKDRRAIILGADAHGRECDLLCSMDMSALLQFSQVVIEARNLLTIVKVFPVPLYRPHGPGC